MDVAVKHHERLQLHVNALLPVLEMTKFKWRRSDEGKATSDFATKDFNRASFGDKATLTFQNRSRT